MTAFEQVLESYAADGYEVLVNPDQDQLPDFAAGFAPDILARKGNEGVLIAVKHRRDDARADPAIVSMAQIVNEHPGWRFDVVVLGNGDSSDEIPKGASEPSLDRISRMLDYAASAAARGTCNRRLSSPGPLWRQQ